MAEDISHKRAMSILKELERITGFDYEDAKDMYKKIRKTKYGRSNEYGRWHSSIQVWEKVMDDYFDILYEMDDGWGDEQDDKRYHIVADSKMDWFMELISSITGDNREKQLEDYNHMIGHGYSPYNSLRWLWDTYMDKYYEYLLGGE